VAAQDQALNTDCFKKRIPKEEIENKCRVYKEYEETIDYLTSRYPILAKNEYIIIHGKGCKHLPYSMCSKVRIETSENWYSHLLKEVCKY
jgi:cobalamin biosynthesis Co2+ chelatase CbiK